MAIANTALCLRLLDRSLATLKEKYSCMFSEDMPAKSDFWAGEIRGAYTRLISEGHRLTCRVHSDDASEVEVLEFLDTVKHMSKRFDGVILTNLRLAWVGNLWTDCPVLIVHVYDKDICCTSDATEALGIFYNYAADINACVDLDMVWTDKTNILSKRPGIAY